MRSKAYMSHINLSTEQQLTGDVRPGPVVIKTVAVVELGVNNGSGDNESCFVIEVWTDTLKLMDVVIPRFGDR